MPTSTRRRVGIGLAALLVAVPAVGVLGTLAPGVPGLGLATGFVSPLMSWVVLVALVGGLLALGLWLRGRDIPSAALVVVAVLTVTAGGVVVSRQVAAVEAMGARIDLIQTLDVWSKATATPDAEVTYTTFGAEPLALSVYRPPPGRSPAPVLFFVHGGGWVAGDRNAHAADLRWFAGQGWLTITADYALSGPDRHLWDVAPDQIGCALAWVTANAHTYGGDASRLSLTGDSAGGNLAINAAYMAANGTLRSSCGGRLPAVSTVSALYPAVDPADLYGNDDTVLGDTSRDFATAYIGGSPTEFPDRYTAVTSSSYVSAAAPPTLLLLGADDHLVPTSGALRFAERARTAGVDVEVVSIPHADHVFDARTGSIGQQAYRQLTAAWLRDHGQKP